MHRALRQQLEALSLAGVTHLPKARPLSRIEIAEQAPTAVAGLVPEASAPATSIGSRDAARRRDEVLALLKPTDSQKTLVDAQPEPDEASPPPSPRTLAEREAALAVLAERVQACTRCDLLARTRKQTVFGVGDAQARIMFIGEAPGADEDAQGEPFVGRAGQLLDKIIAASGLVREQLYICNILKCRPPENRTPADDECANCREYLLGQLATIDPEYIVCWGAVAAQNLLSSKFSVGKMRGRFLKYGRAKVLVTYHPSYLLRNPAAKKDVWDDMKFLMADMGIDLSK